MSTASTEARKFEPLTKPIYTGEELTRRMHEIHDVAIVLSPMTGASDVPQGWKISERYVYAKWEEYEYESRGQKKKGLRGDIYLPFWGQGRVAPTSALLNKIWGAAGGSIIYLRRVDDRKDSKICEVEGQLKLRGLDSEEKTIPCDKRLDLSGGAKAASMTDDQYGQAAKRIHELAMTEAYLRGIRKGLAMEQAYPLEDLKVKPFVVYACVPDPDMSDPRVRLLVTASQLNCVAQLFGQASPQQFLAGAPPSPMIETAEGKVDTATGEIINGDTEEDGPPPPPAATAPAPTQTVRVCECVCGDQAEIREARAAQMIQYVGIPVCSACYPFGKAWDPQRHAHLAKLNLPKYPDLTPTAAASHSERVKRGA